MSRLTIWKWQIPLVDAFALEMPEGAGPMAVQMQHGQPCLWALTDPDSCPVRRCFRLFGTGQGIGTAPEALAYVGTLQLQDGDLVFHLFEELR